MICLPPREANNTRCTFANVPKATWKSNGSTRSFILIPLNVHQTDGLTRIVRLLWPVFQVFLFSSPVLILNRIIDALPPRVIRRPLVRFYLALD
jgi:hypothetical protein